MKKILTAVIPLILIVAMLFSFHNLSTNATNGTNLSYGGIITKETEAWVLETFGEAQSSGHLLPLVHSFAIENFTYDETHLHIPQTLDTNRFIFQRHFHGVCADFAAFVNTVFQVMIRHRQWEDVGCYQVIALSRTGGSGHAINYITYALPDDRVLVFEIDTTWDLAYKKAGYPLRGLTHGTIAFSPAQVSDAIHTLFPEYYSDYKILSIA